MARVMKKKIRKETLQKMELAKKEIESEEGTTSFVPGQTIWVVNDADYREYSKGKVLEVGSSWKVVKGEPKFVTKVRIRYSSKHREGGWADQKQKTLSFEEANKILIEDENEVFAAIISKGIIKRQKDLRSAKKVVSKIEQEIESMKDEKAKIIGIVSNKTGKSSVKIDDTQTPNRFRHVDI